MASWKQKPKINAQTFKFGHDLWDPSHRFETSWILTPWTLFSIRALFSLYAFATIFFNIGWQATGHDGHSMRDVRNSFSYFTDLCYWGEAFYFLAAAIHTFSYALHGGTPILNRFPRSLQALHYLFYTTITTFPFLVTIVYWSLLFPDTTYRSTFALWTNISRHGLNSFFSLFEIVFTRVNPPPGVHAVWLIVLLSCYLGLAYLTHATKGFYTYNFLNPAPSKTVDGVNVGGWGKGGVTGVCFGIAIGILVLFMLVKGAVFLRKWYTERIMERQGKFYGGRRMGAGEVELETQRVWEK